MYIDLYLELQFDDESNDFLTCDFEEKPFPEHHTTTIAIIM